MLQAVADAVGVEARIRHELGLPRFFAETKTVQIAANNVSDGNCVGTDAIYPLDTPELGKQWNEVPSTNVL
jgi:hypothetical protein